MGSGQMPAEAGFPALNAQAALYCYIWIEKEAKRLPLTFKIV